MKKNYTRTGTVKVEGAGALIKFIIGAPDYGLFSSGSITLVWLYYEWQNRGFVCVCVRERETDNIGEEKLSRDTQSGTKTRTDNILVMEFVFYIFF